MLAVKRRTQIECADSSLHRAWLLGGCRNLQDNLSDLRAQVAANTQGAALMHELIREYTIEVRPPCPSLMKTHDCVSCRVMLRRLKEFRPLIRLGLGLGLILSHVNAMGT